MSRREATRTWARIALLSFGGPAGQIAVMHRILVEEKRWIGEERFLHALNFCMLLPGPEAQQLATYIGWLMHGTRGGLVAGVLFVLPGFLAIMAFSLVYALWGYHPLIAGLFLGLKAAVVALIVEAILRIARRALRSALAITIAALAFVAIFLLRVPFPLIVLFAGVFGYLWTRSGRTDLLGTSGHAKNASQAPAPRLDESRLTQVKPSAARALKVLAVWLPLWFLPLAALAIFAGRTHVLTEVGVFFSKMAVVTFGGAYAVLSYVAQQAVQNYHWLTASQMLDGLGLAESTPGPLIMVVQFVGFLAGYQSADVGNPLLVGILAACLTVWVTFIPCFLWIFLGAPYVERLRQNKALSGALAAITAAVVGVIANLALWFALHTLFGEMKSTAIGGIVRIDVPVLSTINGVLLALITLACFMTFWLKWHMGRMLALCALLGIGCSLLISPATAAPEAAPIAVEAKISLGDVAGRIDHLAYDARRQRLYIAELGNDSVGIVDLDEKRLLRTVPGFSEPQGIAYEPTTDSIYVANGGEGTVRVFRASDFALVATIRVGADPDNLRVDAAAKRVYVGYGASSGALAIIDPVKREKIGDIPLKKHAESFQLEPDGDRIFVNVPAAEEIAVVSRASGTQIASWPTGTLHENFALALDPVAGRVIAIFRHPARLAAFDMRTGSTISLVERQVEVPTGKAVATLDTCADADDVFLDAKRNRLYVLCGDGYVDVFGIAAGGKYSRAGRLATSPGSRTGLFIPERERLVVAIRASARSDAAVWLLQ
ncbi:MAG: chromate efflux transporter [Gammaproteobacteria bacterium]